MHSHVIFMREAFSLGIMDTENYVNLCLEVCVPSTGIHMQPETVSTTAKTTDKEMEHPSLLCAHSSVKQCRPVCIQMKVNDAHTVMRVAERQQFQNNAKPIYNLKRCTILKTTIFKCQ